MLHVFLRFLSDFLLCGFGAQGFGCSKAGEAISTVFGLECEPRSIASVAVSAVGADLRRRCWEIMPRSGFALKRTKRTDTSTGCAPERLSQTTSKYAALFGQWIATRTTTTSSMG